jgi:hypothetical protein
VASVWPPQTRFLSVTLDPIQGPPGL